MTPVQAYRPSRCNYLYLCVIDGDGTFSVGPEGWTAARTGEGTYVITHDLGHLRYSLMPTIMNADYRTTAAILAHSENDLTVGIYQNGALSDGPFQIVVMTTQ